MDQRTLPHSLDAEESVLGAILIDNETFAVAASILTPSDFFRDAHKRIYESLCDLSAEGKPLDLVLLKEELERIGQLEEVGGPAYLASLLSGVPRSTNVKYYAEIVAEKARLRNAIFAANKILTNAYLAEESAARIVEDGVGKLTAAVSNVSGGLVSVDDAIVEYIKGLTSGTASPPMPTGFTDLDKVIRGFRRGNLIIVAARPSVGKSSLAGCFAENMAKNDEHSIFFSLEMKKSDLAARNLGWRARVSSENVERGDAEADEYERFMRAAERPEKPTSVWIVENVRTVTEIGAWSRIAKSRNKKLSGIYVDYIQVIGSERRSDDAQSEIANICHGLLRIAQELDIFVCVLSQLSRAPEGRKDKRPQLSDLRGSGALEQDAHVVMLIFREEMHKQESESAGVAEIIVAKNRSGPTGTVKLAFVKELAMFANLAF